VNSCKANRLAALGIMAVVIGFKNVKIVEEMQGIDGEDIPAPLRKHKIQIW